MALDKFHPIGTPDELEQMELSSNEYFSCSAPGKMNRGCRHWLQCTQPFKGQPGHAPENVGVYRESWQSGYIKTMVMPCHRYYDHKREWEESKDVFHIIAHVGEDILLHETYEEPRERVVNQFTQKSMPVVKHRDALYQVPKFPRPQEQEPNRMKAVNVRSYLSRVQAEKSRLELLGGKPEPETAMDVIKASQPEVPVEHASPAVRRGRPPGSGKDPRGEAQGP